MPQPTQPQTIAMAELIASLDGLGLLQINTLKVVSEDIGVSVGAICSLIVDCHEIAADND